MSTQYILLPVGVTRTNAVKRAVSVLSSLDANRAWRVTVELHKLRRSLEQNSYLWGVVYRTILEAGTLEGWTADDLHEYFLGEHFGWETLEGFGRKRLRPIRRSSKLNKQEFTDFIAFIQQRMAEHGLYVPDPNEVAA